MKNRLKVAILDTGIDKNHDYLKANIIGGISFECKDDYILVSDKYDDDNGHGTLCASIIKREFEDIEIFSVKVLDKEGRTNIQVLEEALKYILETDIKLINLSLSVMKSEMVQDLNNICDELNKRGKIVVCSLANGFEESYPAIFDNVIGVKGFILEDENSFWYNKNKNIQCIIDNNSYLNCTTNNSYRLFGKCNSQATAKLTGKIARILSQNLDISLDKLQNELESLAKRTSWTNDDILASKRYPEFKENLYEKNSKILLDTINIIEEVVGIDKNNDLIYNLSLFDSCIGLDYNNCFNLIKKLEKKFNISFNYMDISRYDFISVYTLTELVEKNLNKDGILA